MLVYLAQSTCSLHSCAQILNGFECKTCRCTFLLCTYQPAFSLQAGTSTSGRQLIEQQLDTWQSETWEGETYAHHIDQDRLLIYQILAGQVQQVIPQLDLDWRRALGLHFW